MKLWRLGFLPSNRCLCEVGVLLGSVVVLASSTNLRRDIDLDIRIRGDNTLEVLSPEKSEWDHAFSALLAGASEAPCSAPVLGRARLKPDGLGSRLNQFANELLLAMHKNEPVSLCAPESVRDTWSLYFQDPGFSRCSSCDFRGSKYHDPWQQGWWLSDKLERVERDENSRGWVDGMKHFLYSKMFRFNRDMQAAVDNQLKSLALDDGEYVGVHIRRGDKIKEVPLVPIEQYADAVARLCDQVGAKKVYVASDDASVISELQQVLGQSHDFTFLQQPRLSEDAYSLRGESMTQEAEQNILVDVGILSRASAFVGTASSGIGRLVYFLRDPSMPSTSLDEHGDFLGVPGL